MQLPSPIDAATQASVSVEGRRWKNVLSFQVSSLAWPWSATSPLIMDGNPTEEAVAQHAPPGVPALRAPPDASCPRDLDITLAFCKYHVMNLFITCPVESVERATSFYTALGWTLNAEMSDHNVSCFAIAPEQYVMLGSREMYASVGGAEELVGGPHTPSKVTVSFDLGSREAVDELTERAGAAGGRIGDTDDYPFMYQRQFDDPDGYHYSPFWMKPDADPTA